MQILNNQYISTEEWCVQSKHVLWAAVCCLPGDLLVNMRHIKKSTYVRTHTPEWKKNTHSSSSCCLESCSSLLWYLRLRAEWGVSLWENEGELWLQKHPTRHIQLHFYTIKVSPSVLFPSLLILSIKHYNGTPQIQLSLRGKCTFPDENQGFSCTNCINY